MMRFESWGTGEAVCFRLHKLVSFYLLFVQIHAKSWCVFAVLKRSCNVHDVLSE